MSRSRITSLAVAAALAAGFFSAGAAATTEPQKTYRAKVVLTNKGIALDVRTVARGALVIFNVRNTGTSPRDFFIGGYIVHKLKPGAVRKFQLQFLFRGKYPYYSAGHPGKKFTGSFEVT
jgi:hypothetical protein